MQHTDENNQELMIDLIIDIKWYLVKQIQINHVAEEIKKGRKEIKKKVQQNIY